MKTIKEVKNERGFTKYKVEVKDKDKKVGRLVAIEQNEETTTQGINVHAMSTEVNLFENYKGEITLDIKNSKHYRGGKTGKTTFSLNLDESAIKALKEALQNK